MSRTRTALPMEALFATPEESPAKRGYKAYVIVGVVLAALIAGALVWWLTTRGMESTDDAQVQADVVPLAARVGGAVARVAVQENNHVKAGESVLEIDDADYRLKVQQAEAGLRVAQAALVRANPEQRFDVKEMDRSKSLRAQQVIPEEQLERAEMTARTGRSSVLQAEGNLAAAQAALALARLQASYTKVVAPADGRVSNIQAHAGQILEPDEPFAEFVPDQAYVVANFKETQIGDMHPGQRAELTLDAYDHRVFDARVDSLSAGTGAAFSLLPANNATGNFVKVVQRVPIRLKLVDPPEDLPLRTGLSANVTVYVK